ncbi:hypothetical protein [Neobacillus cucumis]|uniref:Uncharacterized protein n=1 Tax=Neobacillus cucumis TaxID=1740721 RepID=A0A2N5HEW5_9BACI|nr:hypothetical protein [Neobacillus cucumis]PLS04047.1 hypothetical protein CVD27_12880 [Neobacillus cucumis]
MSNLKTVQKKQQFEVFTIMRVATSVSVEAESYEEAEVLASQQLHAHANLQVMMTLINHNGKVVIPTIHDWNTNKFEVIEKD